MTLNATKFPYERKWEDNEMDCPKCGGECQTLSELRDDGHWYNLAERCEKCRWIYDFETEKIRRV